MRKGIIAGRAAMDRLFVVVFLAEFLLNGWPGGSRCLASGSPVVLRDRSSHATRRGVSGFARASHGSAHTG